ncbi:MAG TPA: type II toxin-antitoxin system HicB family antitoxin [Alphaproteobacteria bacterium]|nr:type II toxin-antitoxin system HicB family antitoxin [Alphaproteobacteria bacterium]
MRYYVAIVHKDPDSDFGVSFPDFPGCITAGSTLSEATDMAIEALSGHIELMAADGDAIPEPSDIGAMMSNLDFNDGFPILVPAPNRTA